jgi:hypothetical protein
MRVSPRIGAPVVHEHDAGCDQLETVEEALDLRQRPHVQRRGRLAEDLRRVLLVVFGVFAGYSRGCVRDRQVAARAQPR